MQELDPRLSHVHHRKKKTYKYDNSPTLFLVKDNNPTLTYKHNKKIIKNA